MSDFIRAFIDTGGYIRNDDGGIPYGTIHRETRKLGPRCVTFASVRSAKGALEDKGHPPLIAQLTPEGGVEKLYCFKRDLDEVSERLEYWKGCYGKWPLTAIAD